MALTDLFPIGEWLPDQPELNGGGATVVTNAVTDGKNYKPVGDLSAETTALAANCLGAYSFLTTGGSGTSFAATETSLYRLDSGAWTDVTNAGGNYASSLEKVWNFTQFGDLVLATNKSDKMQKFEVGSDSNFSDLITSGPAVKCANFGVIGNFLVCVDISDSDGDTPNRVRWSPFNDPSGNWTVSQSTQADYEDVQDGAPGAGQAVIGAQNYGIVIFRNAIYRMEYVGPPSIFTFHPVVYNRGALHGNTVASDGARTIFYAEDGFVLFDGVEAFPIGHSKVDGWFRDNLDRGNVHVSRAALDPKGKRYWLAFPSVGGDGTNDKIITYSWVDDRFTLIDKPVQQLFRYMTPFQTLEDIGADYPSLDMVPFTLDSRYWQGGETLLGAFDTAKKLSLFTGSNLTGTFESQEVRVNPSGRAYVKSVLPIAEGGTATARLGYRDLQTASEAYTAYGAVSSITGQADFEREARYHRVGLQLSGAWDNLQGIRFDAEASGVI